MSRPLTKNYRGYTINTNAKMKDIPFGNTCEQVETGVWEWTTVGFKWRYEPTSHAINLQLWVKDHWVGVVSVRDHREAGCFAEGFAAGHNVGYGKAVEDCKVSDH